MAQELTDKIVREEPAPPKGTITLWDSKVKGFGVRIFAPTKRNPDGARSFFLNYRVNGVERRYTIGEFPTYTAKDARAEAIKLRKRIDGGEDPAADKRSLREAPAIQDLIDRYCADHLPTKAAYGGPRENDERKMAAELADGLGRQTKVADVSFSDIERLHRAITASGRPIRANRILALASKAFSLALVPRAGERDPWRTAVAGNPCKGVKKNPEQARELFFNEAQLAALADALDLADERSSADCIRLIMATGCRPCEAMRAQWPEFAEAGRWVKPSAHTKQRRIHRVPLSEAARALIEALFETRKDGSTFLFPSRQNPGEPIRHLRTVWRTTRRRATLLLWESDPFAAVLIANLAAQLGRQPSIEEIEGAAKLARVTLPPTLATAPLYTLRHSFAALGAGSHMSLHVIGKLLGHTQSKTTARYAHLADAPLTEAVEEIGARIGDAIANARRRKASMAG